MPRCIVYKISDLCANLTPRQSTRTPRSFCENEDRHIEQQEYRDCPADQPSQEPLEILIEEEEAAQARAKKQLLERKLEKVIQHLTPTQQDVIYLRLFGFSRAEIARIRRVSQSAVCQTWVRIEEKFQEIGEEYFFGG